MTTSGRLYVLLHGFTLVPVGLAAFYAGLKRLGATRASIVDTAQPAIAAAVGVLALSEKVGKMQVLGIVLVMIAVLGLPLMADKRSRRTEPDVLGTQSSGSL